MYLLQQLKKDRKHKSFLEIGNFIVLFAIKIIFFFSERFFFIYMYVHIVVLEKKCISVQEL